MENTKITKELKILLLKTLKNGVLTAEDKTELVKLLELPCVQIEVINSREELEQKQRGE